jgi:hypothetical protein
MASKLVGLILVVYVCGAGPNETEVGNVWLATWSVSHLVQMIYVIDLLFFDQF